MAKYIIIPNGKTAIFYDDGVKTEVELSDVFVDAQSTLSIVPETVYPGSMAYTAGFQKMWQKDFDGTWTIL